MYYDLLDICDFQGGTQPPKDKWIKESKDGYVRMLQIRDFSQSDDKFIEYVKDSEQLHKCKKDDIMLSRYGYIGQAFMGLEGAYNVALVKVIKKNSVNTKYLYYYFKSNVFKHYLLSNVGARATIPGFNKSELKDAKINIKPLDEQIQIVKILERCEDIINKLNKEIEDFDLLIKARFIEMFGDPIVNEKEWRTKPLLDMGQCKNGMNFHYDDKGVEINCLGVGDFKNLSNIDNTETLPTVSLNEMPSEEYLLKDDDMVFVRSNGNKELVGRSLVVYPGNVPTTFSGFCIRYRKHDNEIMVPYLLRVLKTDSMRMKMAGRGANIQNLNQQILGTLVIPVPPLELQKQFTAFVQQVDKSKFRDFIPHN